MDLTKLLIIFLVDFFDVSALSLPWTELPANFLKEPFLIQNPIIINFDNDLTTQKQVTFAKKFFEMKAGSVRLLTKEKLLQSWNNLTDTFWDLNSFVIIANEAEGLALAKELIAEHVLGTEKPVLVITNNFEVLLDNVTSKMNQMVYFLKLTTLELYDVYTINGITVKNRIGRYVMTSSTYKFLHSKQNLQRDNFHGAHLKGIVAQYPPFTYVDDSFKTKARFFDKNKTYEVTQYVTSGITHDLLKGLSRELNFTYSWYHQETVVWGNMDKSGQCSGMICNIVNDEVDIAANPLALSKERSSAVDFLPTVGFYLPSLFLRSEQPELVGYLAYLKPFSLELWLAICFTAVFTALWLELSNKEKEQKSTVSEKLLLTIETYQRH